MGNCPAMLSPLGEDTFSSLLPTPEEGGRVTPNCCRSVGGLPPLGKWDPSCLTITVRSSGQDFPLGKRRVEVKDDDLGEETNMVKAPWDGHSKLLRLSKSDFSKEHISRISHQFCVANPEFVAADRLKRKKFGGPITTDMNSSGKNLSKSELEAFNRLGKKRKKEEEEMEKLLKDMISKKRKMSAEAKTIKMGLNTINNNYSNGDKSSKPTNSSLSNGNVSTKMGGVKGVTTAISYPIQNKMGGDSLSNSLGAGNLNTGSRGSESLKSNIRSDRQRLREKAQREREKLKPVPVKPIDRVVSEEQVEMAMRSIEKEMGVFCPNPGSKSGGKISTIVTNREGCVVIDEISHSARSDTSSQIVHHKERVKARQKIN